MRRLTAKRLLLFPEAERFARDGTWSRRIDEGLPAILGIEGRRERRRRKTFRAAGEELAASEPIFAPDGLGAGFRHHVEAARALLHAEPRARPAPCSRRWRQRRGPSVWVRGRVDDLGPGDGRRPGRAARTGPAAASRWPTCPAAGRA